MRKKAGAVGNVWVESFKKILDWFLVKLQRTITFALVIRITIILYAFRVEFDFPPCRNWLCWFANSNSPENAIFYISVMFFCDFSSFFKIFVLVVTVLVLTWNFPSRTSKTLNLMGKIAGAVGMVWVESLKKNLDWFLVKLQRGITFALVMRITIILYAFRVEFYFPPW